jgi:hypothetical protein
MGIPGSRIQALICHCIYDFPRFYRALSMSIHFSCLHLLLHLLLNPIIGVHGSVKRLHVCMVGFLCLACDCEHWVCPLRISGRVMGNSCMGDGFTGHSVACFCSSAGSSSSFVKGSSFIFLGSLDMSNIMGLLLFLFDEFA